MFSDYKKNKWGTLAILLIVVCLVWYVVFTESRKDILTVAFLDIGQGDAIFIEAPNGRQILIDGGVNRKILSALSEVLPFYDRSVDIVVATHPDQDHIGGLSEVLKKFNVDFFIGSGVSSKSGAYSALEESIQNKTNRMIAKRGDSIALGAGVYLEVLFPDRDASKMESNSASVVMRLVYGDTSFLLTGDSPKKIEKYLVAIDGRNLQSDVLKLGHHGSRTSTLGMFLSAVDPEYAIVSAGKDNRYGHPHKEVVELLAEFEIKTLETYSSGTIIFESDGEEVILVR